MEYIISRARAIGTAALEQSNCSNMARMIALVALVCAINIPTISAIRFFTLADVEYYQIPLTWVDSNPFESYYIYPIKGNNLDINDTHVFWPTDTNLYSKFYMNFVHAGEVFFGISQQNFAIQRQQIVLQDLGATMLANDHLGLIKASGSWRPQKPESEGYFEGVGTVSLDFETEDDFTQLDFTKLYMRLVAMFLWLETSNIEKLLNAGYNHEQTPLLHQIASEFRRPEFDELRNKLVGQMNEFIKDIKEEDYHNFEKSAFFCLHNNIKDNQLVMENGEPKGWWVKYPDTMVSWRGLMFQDPIGKFGLTAGVQYWVRDGDNLELVFRGTQMYYWDWKGIDAENFVFQVGPPNDGLGDLRPGGDTIVKPTSIEMGLLRASILNLLPDNKRLPWAPREKLCPDHEAEFANFKANCESASLDARAMESLSSMWVNAKCAHAYARFFPCFQFLLRSSEKFSHGFAGITEFSTVYHLFKETPFKSMYLWSKAKPWDDEFDTTMAMFGH